MAVITDPISDMLTRVRNAVHIKQDSVRMPASKLKVSIAKILREEGFIKYFKVVRAGSVKRNPKAGDKKDARPLSHNLLIIYLKYGPGGENVINGLKRISRPGLRRYASCTDVPWVLGGMGITIVSTSQGVMTGRDARKRKTGGEVVCNVW
jgi:small subunit ribosomal protein S8